MNPDQTNEINTWAQAAVAALLSDLTHRAAIALPWLHEAEDMLWTPL